MQLDPHNGEATGDLFDYYLNAPGMLGGGLDKAAAALPDTDSTGVDFHFQNDVAVDERVVSLAVPRWRT